MFLTEEDIKFAELLMEVWHHDLADSFDRSFLTFKAHSQRHQGHNTRKHGSPACHIAFYGYVF